MATSSIFANVRITDPVKATAFIDALDAAANELRENRRPATKSLITDPEEIKKLMTRRITDDILENEVSVSELKNHADVLWQCDNGTPLYLVKDGQERYVVQTVKSYEKQIAAIRLLAELAKGVQSIQNEGSLTIEEAFEGLII